MSSGFTLESLDHLSWSTEPDSGAISAALRLLPKPTTTSAFASTSRTTLDQDPPPSLLDSPVPQAGQPDASSSTAGIDWLRSSLPSHLVDQALAILRSPKDDNDAAAALWELWGDDGLDHVAEAISRRADILNSSAPGNAGSGGNVNGHSASFAPNGPAGNGAYGVPPHLGGGGGDGHQRDHVPGSQVVYQTAEEVAAAKRARKMGQRGKGKGRGDEHDEVDLEEWDRIRQQQLAQGPGALVSGNRVSSARSVS